MTNATSSVRQTQGKLVSIFTSAAAWTALGLGSGLFYREFTRQNGFKGFTQLAVGHTHALALGTMVLLTVLALAKVFALEARGTGRFLAVYNVGLALTFGMLNFKGVLQVLGNPLADSPALAGISGLGHMILTGAFAYFFVLLYRAVRSADDEGRALDTYEASPEHTMAS